MKVAVNKVMELSGINPKRYNFYSSDTNQSFEKNHYDLIFTCGSLHHSYCLYKYFKSIHKALKPNGLLVSQEPAYSEEITGEKLSNLYKKRLNIKFIEDKPIYERYDFFFRLSEYLVTSRFAGLDLHHLKEWDLHKNHPEFYVGSNKFDLPIVRFLKFLIKIPLNFFRNKKYFILSKFRILPRNYLLIFKKPDCNDLNNWKPHLDILGIKEEK